MYVFNFCILLFMIFFLSAYLLFSIFLKYLWKKILLARGGKLPPLPPLPVEYALVCVDLLPEERQLVLHWVVGDVLLVRDLLDFLVDLTDTLLQVLKQDS